MPNKKIKNRYLDEIPFFPSRLSLRVLVEKSDLNKAFSKGS